MTKRTKWGVISVVLAIFVVVGVIYLTADKQTTFVGKVLGLSGLVEVQKSTAANVVKVFENMSFTEGDTIFTREDGQVNVQLDASKLVYVSPNTEVVFTELVDSIDGKGDKNYLNLYEGKVLIDIDEKLQGDSKFEVETPNAIMGVMGTEFIISYENGGTWVVVTEGEVKVERDGEVLTLVPNNKRVFISDDREQPIEVLDIDPEQLQSFSHDFLVQEERPLSTIDLPVLQKQYEERQQLAEMDAANEVSAVEEGQATDEDAILAEGITMRTPPEHTPPSALNPVSPTDGAPSTMMPIVAANPNLPTTIVHELLQRPSVPVINEAVEGAAPPPQATPPEAESRPTPPVAAQPAPSRPETNPAPTAPSASVPPVADNTPSVPEQTSPPPTVPSAPSETVPPVTDNTPSVPGQISPPPTVPSTPGASVPPVADNTPSVPGQTSPPSVVPTPPSETVPPVAENPLPSEPTTPEVSEPPTEGNAPPSESLPSPTGPVETAPPVEETNPSTPPDENAPEESEGNTPPAEPSNPPSETVPPSEPPSVEVPDEDDEQVTPPTEQGEASPSPTEPTDPAPTNPPAEQIPPAEQAPVEPPVNVQDDIVAMKERLQALVLSTTDLVEAVQTEETAVIDDALQAAIEALTSTEPAMETLEQRYNDLLFATQQYMEQKNEETASARAYLSQLMNGVREEGIQQYDDPLLQEALRQGDAVLLNNAATLQEIVQATAYIEQAHAHYTSEVARLVAKEQLVEAYNQAILHDADSFIGQYIAADIAAVKPFLTAEQTMEQYDAMRQQLQAQLQRAIELYEQDVRPLYEQMNTYYYQIEQLANRKEIEQTTADWWHVQRAQHAQAVTVEQMTEQLAQYEQILAHMLFEIAAYEQQLQVELAALTEAYRQMETWLQLQIPTVHNAIFILYTTADGLLLAANHSLEDVQQLNKEIEQTFAGVPALIAEHEQQMEDAMHTLQTLVTTAKAHAMQIVLAPYIASAEQAMQQQLTLHVLQVEIQSLQNGLQRADELAAQQAEQNAQDVLQMRATVKQLLATFAQWQEQQGHLWPYPLLANYKEIREQTEQEDTTWAQLVELEAHVQLAIEKAKQFAAQYAQDVEDAKQQLAQRIKAAQSLEIHQLFILQPSIDAAEQLLATDATLAQLAQAITHLTEAIEAASQQPAPQPVSVLQPLSDKLETLIEQNAALADRLNAYALLQEARVQLTAPSYTEAQLDDLVERLDKMIGEIEVARVQYAQNEPLFAELMDMMNKVDQHSTLEIAALVAPIQQVREQVQKLLENPYVPYALLLENVQAIQADIDAMDEALQQFSEQKQQLQQLLNEVAQWLVDNEAYASKLQDTYETLVINSTIYMTEPNVLFYLDYFQQALQDAQQIVMWTEQLRPYTQSPYSELQETAANVLKELTTAGITDEDALFEQIEQMAQYVEAYESLLAHVEQRLPATYEGDDETTALYLQGKAILGGAYPSMEELQQFADALDAADFSSPGGAQPADTLLKQKVIEQWRYVQHLRTLVTEEEIVAQADAWQQIVPTVEAIVPLTTEALHAQLESIHALIAYYESRIVLANALQQFELYVDDFANHSAYIAAKETYNDMAKQAQDYTQAAEQLQPFLPPIYTLKETLGMALQMYEEEAWSEEDEALLAEIRDYAQAIYDDEASSDEDYIVAINTLYEKYGQFMNRRLLGESITSVYESRFNEQEMATIAPLLADAEALYAVVDANMGAYLEARTKLYEQYHLLQIRRSLRYMITQAEETAWRAPEQAMLEDALAAAKTIYADNTLNYQQLVEAFNLFWPVYDVVFLRHALMNAIEDVERYQEEAQRFEQSLATLLEDANRVYANESASVEQLSTVYEALFEMTSKISAYQWLGEVMENITSNEWSESEQAMLAEALAQAQTMYNAFTASAEVVYDMVHTLNTVSNTLFAHQNLGEAIDYVQSSIWRDESTLLATALAEAQAIYEDMTLTEAAFYEATDALIRATDDVFNRRWLAEFIEEMQQYSTNEAEAQWMEAVLQQATAVYLDVTANDVALSNAYEAIVQRQTVIENHRLLREAIEEADAQTWTSKEQAILAPFKAAAEAMYEQFTVDYNELMNVRYALISAQYTILNRRDLQEFIVQVAEMTWDEQQAPVIEKVLRDVEDVYANMELDEWSVDEAKQLLQNILRNKAARHEELGNALAEVYEKMDALSADEQSIMAEALMHAEAMYTSLVASEYEQNEAANQLYNQLYVLQNRQWLDQVIEEVENTTWSDEEWSMLEEALAKAKTVYNNLTATYAEQNEAGNALINVQYVVKNRQWLGQIIEEVEATAWSDVEWSMLEEALAEAKAVYDNVQATYAQQNEVGYALVSQRDIVKNRQWLGQIIEEVEATAWSDEEWSMLEEALAEAKAVYNNVQATYAQQNEAGNALLNERYIVKSRQ